MANDIDASFVDGLFGLAAGGLSAVGAASENRKQRKWAAAEAEKARKWAEMMSSTAHQREVADLREAGLNPILSATGGNGATTPTAATASSVSTGSPLSEGLSKAIAVFNTIKDGELKTATAKKADADAEKAAAETRKADAEARKANVEATAVEDLDKGARSAWEGFKDLAPSDGVSDLPRYFGMANNAGAVERHQRLLDDKKTFQEAVDRDNKRALEAPIIDAPYGGDVEGDDVYRGVPSDWKYWMQTDGKRDLLHRNENGESWKETYYDVFRKPDGDFVRVRRTRRSYVFKLRRKK